MFSQLRAEAAHLATSAAPGLEHNPGAGTSRPPFITQVSSKGGFLIASPPSAPLNGTD